MSATTIKSDPWFWTISDVVAAFCVSPHSWLEARQLLRLPAANVLERLFRDNDVDGEILLRDVDGLVLREWQIHSLGQRSTIMSVIQRLRNASVGFSARAKEEVNIPILGVSTATETEPKTETEDIVAPAVLPLADPVPIAHGEAPVSRPASRSETVANPPDAGVDAQQIPGRAQEITVVDGNNRKRRRLDLTQQATTVQYHHEEADSSRGDLPSSAPFLCRKALPIDRIFFGDAKHGQELHSQDSQISGPGAFDFEINDASNHPPGCQLYVAKRLQHCFLSNNEYETERDGRPATAKFPYDEYLLKQGKHPSALLVRSLGAHVIATREDARYLEHEASHSPSPEVHQGESEAADKTWEFLEHWHYKDTTVLPAFGDSESDVSYSESLVAEIEKEEEERRKRTSAQLSQNEVESAIEQAVNDYSSIWRKKKLPLRTHSAWATWREAKRKRMRDDFARIAHAELLRLNQRLEKLKGYIRIEPWHALADVQKQCASLEETVYQLQEQTWRKSLWTSPTPPQKVDGKIRIRKKLRTNQVQQIDGDALDDDSDEAVSEVPDSLEESESPRTRASLSPTMLGDAGSRAMLNATGISRYFHSPSPSRSRSVGHERERTFSLKRKRDSPYPEIRSGDSKRTDVESSPFYSPSKKRVKEVKKNRSAQEKRNRAIDRQRHHGEQLGIFNAQVASQLHMSAGMARMVINPDCEDEDAFIFINEAAASRIKEHQINGIRFMWRELVTAGISDPESQGCLLAHTMGLGKTMQTITFLVTVSEAAKSQNPKVRAQVPRVLHKSRTLVVCPPSLIQNWEEEFKRWSPKPREDNVGTLYTVSCDISSQGRADAVAKWYNTGGVLILGYEMLLSLVSASFPLGETPGSDGTVREKLLKGPHIVVLDEAHTTRNKESERAKVCAQFATRFRIALTGSPLANNLEEYYAMINWVAPGYLGNLIEFKAHYKEPIEEGSYEESTLEERHKALKMLHMLNTIIGPKVLRADISVLKGDLPPKTEFVLTMPLTPVQEEAYQLYVQYAKGELRRDANNATVWAWLATLCLLCAHPHLFIEKMKSLTRSETAVAKSQEGTPSEEINIVDEVTEQSLSLEHHPTLIEAQLELFQKHGAEYEKISASNKFKILLQLVKYTKDAGEQLLIFSHSIPTLNYLDQHLTRFKIRFARLDGSTKTSHRQRLTKDFCSGKYDVFVISTKAGGLGLNISTATRVVIFDFCFNPTWEEQAIGRAYRLGQTKPVYVYRFLLGGTFEEKVNNTAIYKTQLATRAVDRKNPRNAASKFKDLLFAPKPVPQASLDEYRGKDPLVLDKILDESGATIRAITTTETFRAHVEGAELGPEDLQEVAAMMEQSTRRKSAVVPSSSL